MYMHTHKLRNLCITLQQGERLHQSRLRAVQEQLDTANASRRSMETYVNFLKASYSSLCTETDTHPAPPFHMLN